MSPLRWGVRSFGLFVVVTFAVSFVLTVIVENDWPPLGVTPIVQMLGLRTVGSPTADVPVKLCGSKSWTSTCPSTRTAR